MLFKKIEKLATENNNPSITLSFNTHRTHPESAKDAIVLKNLASEAEKRLLEEYDKREAAVLLQKLQFILETSDHNYNLDSMHVFVSPETVQVIKLAQPIDEDRAYVDERFAVRPLIKAFNRTELYNILLLSQNGAQLFLAQNDAVEEEIKNDNFPTGENPFSVHPENVSHARIVDNKLKEYLNHVDKAVVREFNETGYRTVVISTPENYTLLQEVADRPDVYLGHSPIDYNNRAPHQIASQAWEIVKELLQQRRQDNADEIQEAVATGRVLTDIHEIFQAAVSGRGDLLAVDTSFSQPAHIVDEFNIELTDDPEAPGAEDDIVSYIAWKTLSAKGRVMFADNNELNDLGPIVLKTRY
jgi:hypothetical protein